jgi:segregation and condensation protein A
MEEIEENSNTYIESQEEDFVSSEDLIVNLKGYEGPLDVLLALARNQKVDLMEISILELVEQYVSFIAKVRSSNLELAADYLVMAAWLAYLKSVLLLPKAETGEELSAEEMAERLKMQLKKLEAIRIRLIRTPNYYLSFYDLLKSYADQRYKTAYSSMTIVRPSVYAMEDALVRLQRLIGDVPEWTKLERFLPPEFSEGKTARSGVAGTLAAAMELAREGILEVQQLIPFGPIFLKNKKSEQTIID